jgi:drug/metabolite transporter (DMT)-like permease
MNAPKQPPMWRADLALVFVCLVWGGTFIIVKNAVVDMPVLLFLAVRFSIAAAVLALIFGLRKNRPPLGASLFGGIVAGFFLYSGYVLQTHGLAQTSAAKTGFITGLYIPLVPILGSLLYRKLPQVPELIGVGLAFTGTALMTIQKDLLSINRGDVLVACSALLYACHIVVLGKFSKTGDVGWLSVLQISTAAVLGWFTWGAIGAGGSVHWTGTVWFALAVTSLLCTAVGFSVQTWAQKYTTATRTALIFSMEPLFAWLASYIAAGEVLTGRAVAGAALILAGVVFAELKPVASLSHKGPTKVPGSASDII